MVIELPLSHAPALRNCVFPAHEVHVGPIDQVAGKPLLGVVIGAGGDRLDPPRPWHTASAVGCAGVLAADEEEPAAAAHSAASRSRTAAARAFLFLGGAGSARGPLRSCLR